MQTGHEIVPSLGKYQFKLDNKDTKTKSMNVVLVFLLLNLNKYLSSVRGFYLLERKKSCGALVFILLTLNK